MTIRFCDSRSTIQVHPNVHGPLVFAILLDLRIERIRELVLEVGEGRLPEVLDDEEANRLRADVLGIELVRAFRQIVFDPGE